MGAIERATTWMEETARDDHHGYCQTHRWGEDGDYDCSGAVITAWQKAGVPVKAKGATYTGNIRRVFLQCGFKNVTSQISLGNGNGLKRGDVLLKEGSHVAMYCGNGKIVDACINEKGTITGGKPGDQTGREFWVHNYYNYPWSHVLRYQESGVTQGGQNTGTDNVVNFTYSVQTEDGKILPEITNLADYAGIRGKRIIGIAIQCDKGDLWYQAHTLGSAPDDWLPKVSGCDWNAPENGFAGNGKPIDAIRIYYNTPQDIVSSQGYQKAQYRVSPVNQNYYDWQHDDEVDETQDGYAGCLGKAIDRFQLF